MKSIMTLAMLLMFICGISPSLANAAGLERVFTTFEVVATPTVNGIELTITGSKGAQGDGFLIQHQSKNYFLPKGKTLVLSTDRPYDLYIAGAYDTDTGLLVTNVGSKRLKFNYGLADVPNDTLDLTPMDDPIRWLLQPSLIANIAGSGFFVDTLKVSGLFNHWDLAEVVYTGDYREKLKKTFWYLPNAEGIYSKIPTEARYMAVQVNLCVVDKGNNRMIIAPSESVKFTRSIMKR